MKFNKNEFGWKEKVNINTDELATKNDIPHYNETLMFEISSDDYTFFYDNSYFNINALNLDETKLYVGKEKYDINDIEEFIYKFVYNKEADVLMDEDSQMYIYNHKSYDGTNFVEDENSAVLAYDITLMGISQQKGYFKLYEVDKAELDSNCLSDNLSIVNSLTVGTRIGDIGKHSVAEGDGNTASGLSSHAEGKSTTASGTNSHAEGYETTASGNISHAEGGYTTASGDFSHAEGNSFDLATDVIQDLSSSTSNDDILTAWNNRQFSLAKGNASHVEGRNCLALGDNSHAEGNLTTASGDISHAEGIGTKASSENQHVQGKYNIEDTENKYAHIVGNGTNDNTRSNAHTLDWQGNGWYKGKLSQEGTPTEDKDLTTKKYVDDSIANQPQISFNDSGELVVTINGVSKTFVPKQ